MGLKFYSTNKSIAPVSLREAVMTGLAPDKGLFMPIKIPVPPKSFFEKMHKMNFQEISFEIAKYLFGKDVPKNVLKKIISNVLNFPVPLKKLSDGIYVLELFHGPTLAFKDFAARVMARLMAYFIKKSGQKLTVLVATSGDTGSAVASGFSGVKGINVIILYPSRRVSKLQEKQLTTAGKNVLALEIKGSFDDCQTLVKQAFADKEIKRRLNLASANSINIARLFPQTFYYFYAVSRCGKNAPVVFSVPSGNFGNLTAGLIAKKMGLKVKRFIAATNINNSVPRYLKTGKFTEQASKATLSNAMDVGNPSNFSRMLELYKNNVKLMRRDIFGISFTDKQTKSAIKEVFEKYKYILDPHGAVAYLGLKKFIKENRGQKFNGIFLETAHPAKFSDKVAMPSRLKKCLNKRKKSVLLSNRFTDLKKFLLRM